MESKSSEEKSEGESKQSAEQPQPEPTPIGLTEPSQGENATQPPQNKPKKRCWSDKRWKHPQVIVNGVLAFIAVIAAIIYFCQLQQMKHQLTIDQRAWVAALRIQGVSPEADKIWQTPVVIKNSGKTFAKAVKAAVLRRAIPKGQLPQFVQEENELLTQNQSAAILAPNSEYGAGSEATGLTNVTQEHLSLVNSGELVVFIFGKVTYNDIFGCSHWTTFCFSFDPKTNTFPVCETHNEPDNNHCP
jgi:hypothetical protein